MDTNTEEIERIKKETDLCDGFCCYEDCGECVRKYKKWLEKKRERNE